VVHYAQLVGAKRFQHYDHGPTVNAQKYGSEDPPEYDLAAVTTPVLTYWGDNDWLGQPQVNFHL
jgi:lysosomal acid lipase/cholesteryl ester hydrolase